VIYNKF